MLAVHSPRRKKWGRHADPSGYGSEPVPSRPGYNPKAIEALGLSPTELARRGYAVDSDVTRASIEPEDGAVSVSGNG